MSVVRFRPWAPIITLKINNLSTIIVINVGIYVGIFRVLPIDLLVPLHMEASVLCIQPGVVKVRSLAHGGFWLVQLLVLCKIALKQIVLLQ